jgi:hypothetical protein
MTAHAICNYVQLVILEDRKAVFVVIPLESYVSESGRDSAHLPSKTAKRTTVSRETGSVKAASPVWSTAPARGDRSAGAIASSGPLPRAAG